MSYFEMKNNRRGKSRPDRLYREGQCGTSDSVRKRYELVTRLSLARYRRISIPVSFCPVSSENLRPSEIFTTSNCQVAVFPN